MLIEKQAIFDVLLDTRAWGEKYVINPFPYIEKDLTKISEKDLKHYKKEFFINLKKYQSFRDKVVTAEAYTMLEEASKKQQQISNQMQLPGL